MYLKQLYIEEKKENGSNSSKTQNTTKQTKIIMKSKP